MILTYRVVKYLREHGPTPGIDMAIAFGETTLRIHHALESLRRIDLAERTGEVAERPRGRRGARARLWRLTARATDRGTT